MQESQVIPNEASPYLMPGEAADMLGVSTTTLATWALKGRVRAVTLPSGHRRYVREDIETLARTGGAA